MSLGLKKEVVSRGVTVFQSVHETAQGGFILDITGLVLGSVLRAGTVLGYDEATRKAVVLKTATLQANATNTAVDYRVEKGHSLKVGDNLAATKGSKAYAITAIDTSNAAYDQVTVGTTLGVALTAGTGLFQSATTGASNSAFITTPRGVLYEDTMVEANADLAVVIRGTLFARRAPVATDEIKAALPLIVFSQSY